MKRNILLKLNVLLVVLFLSGQAITTQADNSVNKYATMRVYETSINSGLAKSSKIIIVYENGQVEEVKLEGMRLTNSNENIKIINAKVNELATKGYELISVTGYGNDINITTYTFKMK